MNKLWRVVAALVAAALVLAACGGGDDDDTSSESTFQKAEAPLDAAGGGFDDGGDDAATGDEAFVEEGEAAQPLPTPAPDRALDEAAADGDAASSGGSTEVPDALQPVDLGRDIIFTAQMVTEAEDVGAARQQALLAIEGLGGLLFGEESSTEPEPRTTLTFRVAPADFQIALGRLGEVGDVRDQIVSADDVTERVVDLESRIRTAEASVDRLRGFLEGATDLEAVARIENQLLERETQLETLNGQLRTIENRVDLATIVLTIVQAELPVPDADITLTRAVSIGHDSGRGCGEAEGVEVDADEEVTVCWTVTNDGEAVLADVEFRDRGIGVELGDVLVVDGDLDEPMLPGTTWVLAYETVLGEDVAGRAVVAATPVDNEGDPLGGQISDEVSTGLAVNESDALPGFSDALESSWKALKRVFGVALIVVAALLPFFWVFLLLGGLIWWLRRRNRPTTPKPAPPASPTPPPAPPAEPVATDQGGGAAERVGE